jgi:integrase
MSNFTDTYIKSLKLKAERFEEYEGGGFGIRVTPAGTKTWVYRYKINGKTDKVTLGHYPVMSLANARARFAELSQQRKDGLSPKALIEQKQQKENNTVGKLVNDWYANYAAKHRKKPLQIKQQIDADIIPSLGRISLEALQTTDIVAALDKIVKRGAHIHANRVLSTIKQALNYAVSRGNIKHNPAGGIRSRDIGGIEKPRDRVLSIAEIKKIWLFLDGDENSMSLQIKNAIKIMLLTGVRTSELRLATWDQFSFEQSLWTIPAENSKGGIIHRVHLSSQVIELLTELNQSIKSKFVLSGADKSVCLSENTLARAISRIQERVGLPRWTAHDLRRTFATHLGETLRVDPVVIEKCLGHKMPRIMATYNKNEMLPEREDALKKWEQSITRLVFSENIIPFMKIV